VQDVLQNSISFLLLSPYSTENAQSPEFSFFSSRISNRSNLC